MKNTKPINRKNYGSIPHLSSSKLGDGDHYITEGQERILTIKKRDKHDIIRVFEKYDGSNVGIAKKDGNIYALTRSGYEAKTSPYKQHHLFSDWVDQSISLFDGMLNEGERICGEWLAQAHGIQYNIADEQQPIVFYDLIDEDNQRLLWNDVVDRTHDLPIDLARHIHYGDPISPKDLQDELRKCDNSFYPIDGKPEGMIYRVERKDKVDFLAKWVRKDFKPGLYCINVDEKDLIWNI